MIRYLTTQQVAEELSVSSNTVRRWIETQDLKWHDVGVAGRPRIRISETDLKAWLEARKSVVA